jgi:hypothetical protein
MTLGRGFLIYEINSPKAGISFVEGISVWRREDLRAVQKLFAGRNIPKGEMRLRENPTCQG